MASVPPPWRQPFPWRASSAPDKRRREHDDQRDADVNVKQKLIQRIIAKLPVDWHCDRSTLLETCKPPHLGVLNKNIKKDTPISICTFGIENFERLGRGERTVERDIQLRAKNNSHRYDVLKSKTDKQQAAVNAARVIDSLERNHPEICSGRYIVLVDCRSYHDPEFGKNSYHLGWKDETLAGLVNNEEATCAIIDQVIEGIKDFKWMNKKHLVKVKNGLVIACMCRSGFHRSLVSAKCVHHVLAPVHDEVKVFHLSQGEWLTRGCQRRGMGRCPLCQEQSRTQLCQLALALYQQNFDERLADALGLNDSIRTPLDATRSASSSKAPATVTKTPTFVRPTSKKKASKSSRKIHEPARSRSPPRPSSAPRFTCTGASEHTCPCLTTDSEESTTFIDQQITSKCRTALHDLLRSPQGKVMELIGRSSVECKGVAWNNRLRELCMFAVEEANVTFEANDDNVLTELYKRLTMIRTRNESRQRTEEEINAVVAFWWKLQTYRRQYLKRNCRVDTTEEVLSEAEVNLVKKNWKDDEMYWDLSDDQRNLGHLPSLYNAALNNRSGWSSVANATIKYQLPQVPHVQTRDGVTHVPPDSFQRWCCDLLQWLKKFTSWEICRIGICTRPPLPR